MLHDDALNVVRLATTFVADHLGVEPSRIHLSDRRASDLGEMVESIAGEGVREITGPVVATGTVLGTVLGGFAAGIIPGLGDASEMVAAANHL